MQRIQSFREFWPYYLGEHSHHVCRKLHFLGTSIAVGFLALSAFTLNPFLLIPAVVSGYFWAWIGHFVVEKNRPATFTYPLWSLIADFKMWGYMLRGKLWANAPVLPQAGIATPGLDEAHA